MMNLMRSLPILEGEKLKNNFYFSEVFYSFIGGVIASFGGTILYETIDKIGEHEYYSICNLFEWCSVAMIYLSSFCFLKLAVNIQIIQGKVSSFGNIRGERSDLWLRAIRAIAEKDIENTKVGKTDENNKALINKVIKKIYIRIFFQLYMGIFFCGLGIMSLFLSKVVNL